MLTLVCLRLWGYSQQTRSLQIRKDCSDSLGVGTVNQATLTQIAFSLGGLLGQDVAGKRFTALDLAGACLFETLGCASVCFHLWHNKTPLTSNTEAVDLSLLHCEINCDRLLVLYKYNLISD